MSTTDKAQLNTAIIRKMADQLRKVIEEVTERADISTVTKNQVMAEMQAQLGALTFAHDELVRAYGEPPVIEGNVVKPPNPSDYAHPADYRRALVAYTDKYGFLPATNGPKRAKKPIQ